jgi:hypothetical protein
VILPDQAYGPYPAIWQSVSATVKNLVMQMCHPDPDQRCSLVDAMKDDMWGKHRVSDSEAEALNAQGAEAAHRMTLADPISELF